MPSGQWTAQAWIYTSLEEAYFFRGHPRQSHTHGQLGSTSSSMAFAGSMAGIIWMVLVEPETGIVAVGRVTAAVEVGTDVVFDEVDAAIAVVETEVEAAGDGTVEEMDVVVSAAVLIKVDVVKLAVEVAVLMLAEEVVDPTEAG